MSRFKLSSHCTKGRLEKVAFPVLDCSVRTPILEYEAGKFMGKWHILTASGPYCPTKVILTLRTLRKNGNCISLSGLK